MLEKHYASAVNLFLEYKISSQQYLCGLAESCLGDTLSEIQGNQRIAD